MNVSKFQHTCWCCLSPGAVVQVVQIISKWACPDMFAYILLVHLVRLLDNGSLILTAATLGQCPSADVTEDTRRYYWNLLDVNNLRIIT